jgi:hypothetical protein
MTTEATVTELEDLCPSACFTRILLQSGQYSLSTSQQQPCLQADAEKLLVQCATLFARELVSKSAAVENLSRSRTNDNHEQTEPLTMSIRLKDVDFVLKHQWPIYHSASYNQLT